jgi:hypothetical protein
MKNLSSGTKVAQARPKYERLPEIRFRNSIPYESREEPHRILPSPVIKRSDYYYQDLSDAAFEVIRDLTLKKMLLRKRRENENNVD